MPRLEKSEVITLQWSETQYLVGIPMFLQKTILGL